MGGAIARVGILALLLACAAAPAAAQNELGTITGTTVSYTHLTLPTILRV